MEEVKNFLKTKERLRQKLVSFMRYLRLFVLVTFYDDVTGPKRHNFPV